MSVALFSSAFLQETPDISVDLDETRLPRKFLPKKKIAHVWRESEVPLPSSGLFDPVSLLFCEPHFQNMILRPCLM